MLVPPDSFGLVEEGIYRCGKIDPINFAFLETLKLKSLVLLDPEKPPRPLRNFLEDNGTDLHHLGGLKISKHYHASAGQSSRPTGSSSGSATDLEKTNFQLGFTDLDKVDLNLGKVKKDDQWMLIERNLILRAFEIILNKSKFNVLLVDSTQTLIGILRKIEKWNFSAILNEYRLYNSTRANYFAEIFLELIQIELISSETEPSSSTRSSSQTIETPKIKFESQYSKSVENQRKNSLKSSFGEEDRYLTPKVRRPSFVQDNDMDYDDEDDKLLSGSPQIPANLLRLVEMRKIQKSAEESDSSTTIIEESEDATSSSLSPSSEGRQESSTDYMYYKILNNDFVKFSKANIVQIKLPGEENLPNWFVRYRDDWELQYSQLNI